MWRHSSSNNNRSDVIMNACEVVILIELNVVLALGEESNEQLHHDVVSSYLEVLVEASNLYGGSLSPAIFAPISSPNRLPAIIFNTLSSPVASRQLIADGLRNHAQTVIVIVSRSRSLPLLLTLPSLQYRRRE